MDMMDRGGNKQETYLSNDRAELQEVASKSHGALLGERKKTLWGAEEGFEHPIRE